MLDLIKLLQTSGIKIGSTTGYTRELMEVVLPLAAAAGYSPDSTVCSDEVVAGRPAPWSNFRAAELIGVYPMDQVVVVDDSVAGIQAGKAAGCFSVAVTTTGNAIGKSLEELSLLPEQEIQRLHARAEAEFYDSGADLVVESAAVLQQFFQKV